MKKKRLMYFFLLFIIFLLLAFYYIFFTKTVDIIMLNRTDKPIYTTSMQWIDTKSEPTIEEMAQIKHVWEIEPGGEHIFSAYFSSLISSKTALFSPDWRIGSRVDSPVYGVHTFKLDMREGSCRVKIEIYTDSYKIIPEETFYCYKKLLPVAGRMIIHTKEKTIFNDYGASTDKIEKQFIRLN